MQPLLPAARFALTPSEVARLDAKAADDAADPDSDEEDLDEPSGDLDPEATGEEVEDELTPALPPASNDGEPIQAAA